MSETGETHTRHTPVGRVKLARFARVRLLGYALPTSLLILRTKKKKPTVLQSMASAVLWNSLPQSVRDFKQSKLLNGNLRNIYFYGLTWNIDDFHCHCTFYK